MGRIISGLSDVADRYDYFILDIFGVIHNGIGLFPGTKRCLGELRAAGKQVCLLSNSPNRAARAIGHMGGMGLAREAYDHVVTSGEATHRALGGMQDGQRCWLIGTEPMKEVLDGHKLPLADGPEAADFVLNSVPGLHKVSREEFMDQLRKAADLGLPMICANPDLVVNIGPDQYECAGTFALEYEHMGGDVTYHGKPYAPIYEWCYELLGQPDKSRVCAVGDSFHTDITGANRFGIDVVWNIEGVHEEEVTCDLSGGISDDLIADVIESQDAQPTYVMKDFQW